MSLPVVTRSGAKPCFSSNFLSNRLADRAQRRRWTKKSSTSPTSSTARHSRCFRPRIFKTISSRCQRGLGRGRLRRRLVASKITGNQPPELRKPAPRRLVRNVDATLGQQFLDITERQRELGIEPNRMLDDHWRKAMSLEGYWGHMPTVATPNRPDQALNVSMPFHGIGQREYRRRPRRHLRTRHAGLFAHRVTRLGAELRQDPIAADLSRRPRIDYAKNLRSNYAPDTGMGRYWRECRCRRLSELSFGIFRGMLVPLFGLGEDAFV